MSNSWIQDLLELNKFDYSWLKEGHFYYACVNEYNQIFKAEIIKITPKLIFYIADSAPDIEQIVEKENSYMRFIEECDD